MTRSILICVLLGLALLAASTVDAGPASAAPAVPHRTTTLAQTTIFSYTGAEQTYVVPPNTTSLRVVAVGGKGGNGMPSGIGGFGASVIAFVYVNPSSSAPIKPGSVLYVYVGGNGASSVGRGTGGFNGGGQGQELAGGGGGATDLRTCSSTAQTCANGAPSLLTRVVVAAGGGGAGADAEGNVPGNGGSAGESGGRGTSEAAGGGAGATLEVPGKAGPGINSTDGALGVGGRGDVSTLTGDVGGGGGGGGYLGGGGGGGAAGGGGGSSFASPLATTADALFSLDTTGIPSMVIETVTTLPGGARPPNTRVTGGASRRTADRTPTFSFASDLRPASFSCRIDGGRWAACSSPYDLPRLAFGSHTFRVRAVSPSGVADATPAVVRFTVVRR